MALQNFRGCALKKISIATFLVFIILVALWQVSKSRTFQFFGELVNRVDTDKKIVALTFDDGPWSKRYTAEVITLLSDLDVQATFFVNGRGVEGNPREVEKMLQAGHALGNHAYSHARLVLKSFSEIESEVERTNRLIRQSGFKEEIYFRPPYGSKLFVLPWYLAQQGITTITWDVEPETYLDAQKDAASMVDHVVKKTTPGSIILLHVLGSKNDVSREALPLIIRELRLRGFRFVLLPELLASPD